MARKKGTRKKTPVQKLLTAAREKMRRDLPGAVLTYGKILELEPDNKRARLALQSLTAGQRQHMIGACKGLANIDAVPHALVLTKTLRKVDPDEPDLAILEARLHCQLSDFPQAYEAIATVANAYPEREDVQIVFGSVLAGVKNSKRAIEVLKPLFDAGKLSSESINAFASSLYSRGQIEESRDVLLSSARAGKLSANGIYSLTQHTDLSQEPAILDQLVGIFADETAVVREREMAAYSLAVAHDKQKDFATAFEFFQAANLMKKEDVIISYMAEVRSIGERVKSMTSRISSPSIIGQPKHRHIFIVGLPRSGTTLTEQILTQHSDVFTIGESPQLGTVFKDFSSDPSPEIAADAIRAAYDDALPPEARDARVIVDKMPSNAFVAGMALKAMPDARVIHSRRHPMACGFSAFKIRFAVGNSFAYRFDTIAEYYRYCERMAQYWAETFPDRVMPVYYEAMTEDPERWIAKLVEFCDLDLQEGMTDYRGSSGEVHTASAAQVRKKIYKGSSETWKNYADHLVPLMANLIEEIAIYEVALDQARSTGPDQAPRTQLTIGPSAA